MLGVTAGAAAGTRRLFVGDRQQERTRFAISVPNAPSFVGAVDTESEVLGVLAEQLPGDLVATLPHEVERVFITSHSTALVVSAVPGIDARSSAAGTSWSDIDDVVTWLSSVWAATAREPAQVQLGAGPVDLMMSRYRGAAQMVPAIGSLVRARRRLETVEVTSTATHGCLCRRHVYHDGSSVTGVDDWGLGNPASDPIRDLGRFSVDLVGADLPEAIAARSRRARAVRHAVASGLESLGAPTKLWRDVLILAQLEVATNGLARGDRSGIELVKETVQAMPTRR